MKNIILFLYFIFFSQLQGQINDARKIQLEENGLYLYPKLNDLKNISLDDTLIKISEIYTEDVSPNFDNFDDLVWLEDIAKEKTAILMGENHWFEHIQNLRNRIYFALNTFDYYPLIVLESQYSFTEYVNYYISIQEDSLADVFFEDELLDMFQSKATINLIHYVREWNKRKPDKYLRIGFSDIEHNMLTTMRKIIIPYFQKYNIENIEVKTLAELRTVIEKLREYISIALSEGYIGKYSFLTPQYIARVIDNIESKFNAEFYSDDYYRQKAIIRNLTENEFLAKYWLGKKLFIHGGYYHTPTKFEYPGSGNFLREGSYLTYEFPYTLGKTYSIRTVGFFRSLGNMAEFDMNKLLHVGTGYRNTLSYLQNLYNKGLIKADDCLLEWKPSAIDSLLIKKSLELNQNGMLITDINWARILEIVKSSNPEFYSILLKQIDVIGRYNKSIYILESPISEKVSGK